MSALRAGLVLVPAVIAGGALLRVAGLEIQSLWVDEFMAFHIGQQPLDVVIGRSMRLAGQSPLYYVVMRGWTLLLGENSVLVIRSFSAIFGVLALIQLWAFGRRFVPGPETRVALIVLAFSPFHLYFSQEARMYALFVCEVLAIAHLSLDALERPQGRSVGRMAALGLLTALTLYTHYYAVLFLAAIDLFVLLRFRDSPAAFWRIVIAQGVGAALYLPWVPAILAAGSTGGASQITYAPMKILYVPFTFSLGYSSVIIDADRKADLIGTFVSQWPILTVGGAAFGWFALRGALALWAASRRLFTLVALVLVFPLATSLAISFFFPIISERYLTPGIPFFALLLGFGIVAARGPARWIPLAIGIGLVLHSLGNYYANPRFGKHDWRAVSAHVAERMAPGDAILFHPEFVRPMYDFYADPGPGRVSHDLDSLEALERVPGASRYWLVVSHPKVWWGQLKEELDRRYPLLETWRFKRGEGIDVYLYEGRP